MSWEKRGTKALDHSHHISDYARRYIPSPLKGLQKYFDDDLIPFAGGASVSRHSNARCLIFLQASPAPITSPSPQYLQTSSSPMLSKSTHRDPHQPPLPIPRHSAGFGASSVPARTIRRAFISLVSRALAMEDSTSPRR
jgi:hypothetical protein